MGRTKLTCRKQSGSSARAPPRGRYRLGRRATGRCRTRCRSAAQCAEAADHGPVQLPHLCRKKSAYLKMPSSSRFSTTAEATTARAFFRSPLPQKRSTSQPCRVVEQNRAHHEPDGYRFAPAVKQKAEHKQHQVARGEKATGNHEIKQENKRQKLIEENQAAENHLTFSPPKNESPASGKPPAGSRGSELCVYAPRTPSIALTAMSFCCW